MVERINKVHKLLGVIALLLAIALIAIPVFSSFILTGFGIGLFFFLGIGGTALILS